MKGIVVEGTYTDDPLNTYGGFGVVEIPDLQELLKKLCLGGFAHHVAATLTEVADIVFEALSTYFNLDIEYH